MVCILLSICIVSPSSLTCVTPGALSSHCRGSRVMVHLCPSAPHFLQSAAASITVTVTVVAQDRGLHRRNNFRVSSSYLMVFLANFHQHHHQHYQSGNLPPYLLNKCYRVYTFTVLFSIEGNFNKLWVKNLFLPSSLKIIIINPEFY